MFSWFKKKESIETLEYELTPGTSKYILAYRCGHCGNLLTKFNRNKGDDTKYEVCPHCGSVDILKEVGRWFYESYKVPFGHLDFEFYEQANFVEKQKEV